MSFKNRIVVNWQRNLAVVTIIALVAGGGILYYYFQYLPSTVTHAPSILTLVSFRWTRTCFVGQGLLIYKNHTVSEVARIQYGLTDISHADTMETYRIGSMVNLTVGWPLGGAHAPYAIYNGVTIPAPVGMRYAIAWLPIRYPLNTTYGSEC